MKEFMKDCGRTTINKERVLNNFLINLSMLVSLSMENLRVKANIAGLTDSLMKESG